MAVLLLSPRVVHIFQRCPALMLRQGHTAASLCLFMYICTSVGVLWLLIYVSGYFDQVSWVWITLIPCRPEHLQLYEVQTYEHIYTQNHCLTESRFSVFAALNPCTCILRLHPIWGLNGISIFVCTFCMSFRISVKTRSTKIFCGQRFRSTSDGSLPVFLFLKKKHTLICRSTPMWTTSCYWNRK